MALALFRIPIIYIVILVPYETTSQSVSLITDWLVSYFKGLPTSIIGDLGGNIAAAIINNNNE